MGDVAEGSAAMRGSVAAWQLVHENERLRDEVARLRLTDEDRKAIAYARDWCKSSAGGYIGVNLPVVLDALLERTTKSDRPKPIADARLAALERLSALDQKLELSHGTGGNPMIKGQRCTQPTHTTPCDGSVPSEGTSEPVAWWLKWSEYDTGCDYEYVSLLKEDADAVVDEGATVIPLYRQRQPTLTDAEREAIDEAIKAFDEFAGDEVYAATLRGLLERLR